MVWHIVAEEMYVRGRGCCGGVVLRVKCADGGIKVADLYVIEVGYVSGAKSDGIAVTVGGTVW